MNEWVFMSMFIRLCMSVRIHKYKYININICIIYKHIYNINI